MAFWDISSLKPWESRKLFRTDSTLYGKPSASYSLGYLQANIAIIPSELADDFNEFCRQNQAPCPILYRSKSGELDTPMSKGSDIRTEVTGYVVTKYNPDSKEYIGLPTQDVTNVTFDNMVTFYIGCSFSFEGALIDAGIHIDHVVKTRDVSMFKTNIKCNPVGLFSCDNMVVSMRFVKKQDIEKAVGITAKCHYVHGAPIHIGDPSIIGINDIYKPDFGDPADMLNIDEAPLFWACGVTSFTAVKTAKPDVGIYTPCGMFIFDVSSDDFIKEHPPPHGNEVPRVIPLQEEPYFASILGENTLNKINQLEQIIQDDPGNRGIKPLFQPGELVKAALRVSHANSIAIVTGFPVKQGNGYIPENDGPLGAITMAKAFQALGKTVILVGSHYTSHLLQKLVQYCVDAKYISKSIQVNEFTPNPSTPAQEAALDFLYPNGDFGCPEFDVLIAIESVGKNEQGQYKSMLANDLTSICERSPVDDLFIQAKSKGNIFTVGIGDGGNEIGMGNVKQQVQQHIKNGSEIACDIKVDYLITAGVSNWGGLALASSVYLLQNCILHNRYRRHGIGEQCKVKQEEILNSHQQEKAILEFLTSQGVVDGVLGKPMMSVDGMDFNGSHQEITDKMFEVIGI